MNEETPVLVLYNLCIFKLYFLTKVMKYFIMNASTAMPSSQLNDSLK